MRTRDPDFAVFDDEHDVDVRTPSLARVLLALVGAGVLVAATVIVIASLLTASQPAADTLCGSSDSCTDLTVAQVGSLTALALPFNAEVVSSRYEASARQIVVEATVRLPLGSPNPFDGSAYFVVSETPLDLPSGEPFGFYAATGEMGALQADGALVEGGTGDVVVVRVVRAL